MPASPGRRPSPLAVRRYHVPPIVQTHGMKQHAHVIAVGAPTRGWTVNERFLLALRRYFSLSCDWSVPALPLIGVTGIR